MSVELLVSEDGKARFQVDVEMQQVRFARFGDSTEWVTMTQHADDDEDKEGYAKDKAETVVNIVNPEVQVQIPRELVRYLSPLVGYYGWHVPRWYFFAGLQNRKATIDPRVFARVIELTRQWTRSEPEILGQVVGWLGWQVEYQRDHSFVASEPISNDVDADRGPKATTKGTWVASDEFDNPMAQLDLAMRRTNRVKGDCEDIAILHNTCFEQVPNSLCPIKQRYCFFNVDVSIASGTQHSCSILVPWSIVRYEWLSGSPKLQERLPSMLGDSKNVYELPILVIESTDMTLTEFTLSLDDTKKNPSLLKKRIHEEIWAQNKLTEDQFSYPFADVSYQEQGYFKCFVFAYSPQLLAMTNIGAWQLTQRDTSTLGISLEQLVRGYGVSLVPRQPVTTEELAEANEFMRSRVPRLYDFRPNITTSLTSVLKAKPTTKDPIPVYSTKKPDANELDKWIDLSGCGLTWRKSLYVRYM